MSLDQMPNDEESCPPMIFHTKLINHIFFGDICASAFMSCLFQASGSFFHMDQNRLYIPLIMSCLNLGFVCQGAQNVTRFLISFNSTAEGNINILSPCPFLT